MASGEEAREINEQSSEQRLKINYIRLKEGEFVRGYLLGDVVVKTVDGEDKTVPQYHMFASHGDWQRRIHNHACSDPRNATNCLSCQQGVARDKLTIVPFWDIDARELRIWTAKKGHMRDLYSFFDLYGEDSTKTPVFIKRVGKGKETKYQVLPAPPTKPAEKKLWEYPSDVVIDDSVYMSVVQPPKEDYLRKLLGLDAGAVEDADIVAIPDGSEEDDPLTAVM